METATISYRVADFLRKYPPFQAMDDTDLLSLAGHGRVRFHERNEHILSQGESHRHHVFIIQQGVVSLWSDVNGMLELRDVRGAGDLLGVERFNGAPASLYSARAATDVVIYALPADEFESLLEKYANARQYVSAYSTVTLDYQGSPSQGSAGDRRPEDVFLHDLVKVRRIVTCDRGDSIRAAARAMGTRSVDAIAVVEKGRVIGVVTSTDLIAWLADGTGNPEQPVGDLVRGGPIAVSPAASIADGVLTMGAAAAAALAITADGKADGELHALVTAADLSQVFGDQPVSILREIRGAAGTAELRALNHRARAFALRYLDSARSVDWLERFTTLVDESIATRVIARAGLTDSDAACWACSGSSGRGESMTRLMPELTLTTAGPRADASAVYARVTELLAECDYLPRPEQPFDTSFYAAGVAEWKERFVRWVRNPILEQMYLARGLFDLRPMREGHPLHREIEAAMADAIDHDFIRIIANDCVARLPPLTFFQDAVVDDMGERTATFQLDRNALTPLVDVARVYGIAAGRVLGGSTRDRFAMARRLLPQHEAIFREAADTLRIVLWLQGRVGIGQGTGGGELPPGLLSRHDRQVLKSGFRVIHRLIELTADYQWLDAL
jgi:CBS domain-containing protein